MKIRKNLLLVVLALTLSFVLSACGSSNPSAEEPETTEPETVEIDANGENVLITDFSVMETDGVDTVAGASRVAVNGEVLGNNEYIAQIIQRETGGDLFPIETEQDYPTTHERLLEFAYNEKADNARPKLAAQIENPGSYDVIFLGYPKMEQAFSCV